MEAGTSEVVYSQTEQIGMPNWSNVRVMASAKLVVARDHESEAYDYLAELIGEVIANRTNTIFNSLQAWATNGQSSAPEFADEAFDLSKMGALQSELTFSINETIGLPKDPSGGPQNINLLHSRKIVVDPGHERAGFLQLFEEVQKAMAQRRGIVQQAPRPWVTAA